MALLLSVPRALITIFPMLQLLLVAHLQQSEALDTSPTARLTVTVHLLPPAFNVLITLSPMLHLLLVAQLQQAESLATLLTARLTLTLLVLPNVQRVLLAICLILQLMQLTAMPCPRLSMLTAPWPLQHTFAPLVPTPISWDLAPAVSALPTAPPALLLRLAALAAVATGWMLLPKLVALLSAPLAAVRVPLPVLALPAILATTRRVRVSA